MKDANSGKPMLRMTEMMLEAEIAMYAAHPTPRNVEVEMTLRERVRQFLYDSHNAGYVKGRYIRHVTFIIAQAIIARTGVPWEEVHSKAWMRGTKSNVPDDFAIQHEVFVPAPCSSSQRRPNVPNPRGILKTRPPPSPAPAPLDPREPPPVVGPCKRCTENGVPCQRSRDWLACIACHSKRERCSLTPIARAYGQAAKNRAALDAADTAARDVVAPQRDEILQELRKLNTLQEETLRGIEEIIVGQKCLQELLDSWMSTEE